MNVRNLLVNLYVHHFDLFLRFSNMALACPLRVALQDVHTKNNQQGLSSGIRHPQ